MTASNADRPVSRRTALAGLGAAGLGLALATRRSAVSAQEATPAGTPVDREDHPLVGAWRVDEVDHAPQNLATYAVFDASGTWVHLSPPFIAIGIWRPTGERTAEGVEFYAFPNDFERLFDLGSPVPEDVLDQAPIKNRFDVAIDASGNAFETTGFVVDEEGNDDPTSPYQRAGVRMAPVLDATATPAT